MTLTPFPTVRVSTLQRATVASATIDGTQVRIQQLAQELSTGKAVTVASDNPAAAAVIQQLQQSLNDGVQYTTNLTASQDQLNEVDATLGDLNTLVTQATSTASANVSSTTTADARSAAADTIDSIYNQVASTANKQYEGRYLFGGADAASAPYQATAAGFQFVGSTTVLSGQADSVTTLSYQVSGTQVFGGQSGSVSAAVDVSPVLLGTTRLVDLAGAGGEGVTPGTITVGNGTTTAAVNLTGADNVQDVVDAINAAAVPGVTASVGGNGINLAAAGGANVTVADTTGGTTAADLGILKATGGGANVTLTGQDVGAKVTDLTPLSALRDGAGLDPAGFKVTNGSVTRTVSLAGLTSVQDLLNKVNASGAGVRASVRPDGTGIDLTNNTQGADLSVVENGGTTAAELGFKTTTGTTALSGLNKGRGVSQPAGTQFTIGTADGSTVNVALTAATTVQDVLNQINAAAGTKVTAALSTTGNGVTLTDNTTGAGSLKVTPVAGATTAADLGLTTGTTAAGKLTGTDVNPVATPGLLTDLGNLRDALRKDDTAGITTAAAALSDDAHQVTDVRGVVGARVQELTSRSSGLSLETVSTRTLLSSYQDVDYTTAVTQYQALQYSLQASLQTTAKTLNLSLMNYLG